MKQTANRTTSRKGWPLAKALRATFVCLLSLLIALPPTYLASSVVYAPNVMASTYAQGNGKYQKGDFKGAETALRQALQRNLPKAEKIKTLKLLGICQYMLGNKGGAASSFKQALALNPGLTIAQSEVLDDSVIPYFNSQKSAPRPSAAAKPAYPPPKPASAPSAPLAGTKPLKQTFLKVLSNVPTAQISIDGIIAGGANSLINTDPGKVQIEVTSPGYITRKINVNVVKNRENTVTINLEKPKPKPKKPKPKLQPSAPSGPTTVAATKPGKRPGKRPGKKAGGKNNVYAPTPGDDLFIDDAAATGSDTSSGGGGGGGPDLAQQFEMESGTGYGAPPPGYGTPPAATPGYGYQPPPVYYAPPPPTYYAPPPTYYTPPPPPPPAGDPYAGAYQDPGAPPDPAGAAGPADPGGSDRSEKKSSNKGPSTLMLIGPFGLGQFVTDRPLFGLLVMGAQAGGLYFWYSQMNLANQTATDTTTYLNANCNESNGTLSDEEKARCSDFRNQRQAYVDDLNSKAMMGMGLFAVAWAGGAIEALIYDPPKPKKKRKKKSRYGGFSSYSGEEAPYFSLLDEPPENRTERASTDFRWDMGVLPREGGMGYDEHGGATARYEPSLTLDLKWTF